MIQKHPRNSQQTVPSFYSVRLFVSVLTVLLVSILSGCASYKDNGEAKADLHVLVDNSSSDPLTTFAPVFILPDSEEAYNRIGKVVAKQIDGDEKITVDSDQPVFYADKVPFPTQSGNYTNLVYRVHFQKTPFSLIPFHFAAGNNLGLLVIVTLNEDNIPLLVTTANTCGCYALILPTAALPAEAYPRGWVSEREFFYGERLPTGLPAFNPENTLLITVRPEVHRIMNVAIGNRTELAAQDFITASIMPLQSLKSLPLAHGEVTSTYYDTWPLRGHVKGSIKPWESLLLSLVSLDFYVGMDKEYGDTAVSGNPFYTSLVPWNREASDMNNFAQFLHFWGWGL
jgi:hypothetical protein